MISANDPEFVEYKLDPFIKRLKRAGFINISHGWGYAPANAFNAGAKRYHVRATAPSAEFFTESQRHLHTNLRAYYTWYNGRWQGQWHTRLPKGVK